MVAFQFRMGAGIPGGVARIESANIVPENILSTNPPTRYGDPVAYDPTTGYIRPIIAGDTAASVIGFLVRPFPTQSADPAWPNDPLSNSGTPAIPPTNGIADVLKAGYINVAVAGAALATKGSPVYVRVGGATRARTRSVISKLRRMRHRRERLLPRAAGRDGQLGNLCLGGQRLIQEYGREDEHYPPAPLHAR